MNAIAFGRRWLASVTLGTVAPLVIAQIAPVAGVPQTRGGWRDSPQWLVCKRDADARNLLDGLQRKAFLQHCLKTAAADSDAAAGAALRNKMLDGQGGHLHSEPATPPPSAAQPAVGSVQQ